MFCRWLNYMVTLNYRFNSINLPQSHPWPWRCRWFSLNADQSKFGNLKIKENTNRRPKMVKRTFRTTTNLLSQNVVSSHLIYKQNSFVFCTHFYSNYCISLVAVKEVSTDFRCEIQKYDQLKRFKKLFYCRFFFSL